MSEAGPEKPQKDMVKITAIVVAGVIILACIIASATITIAFFVNAPW